MDTQDTSPSVLLFFDKQRFIFNAGEVSVVAYFKYFTVLGILKSGIEPIFMHRPACYNGMVVTDVS